VRSFFKKSNTSEKSNKLRDIVKSIEFVLEEKDYHSNFVRRPLSNATFITQEKTAYPAPK